MSLETLAGWRTRKDWMLLTKLDRKESHSSSVLNRTDIGTQLPEKAKASKLTRK